jgi:uncharacterized membrane protein
MSLSASLHLAASTGPVASLPLASPLVSLFVRWLHVVAATVALGGAVLVWGAHRESGAAAGVDLDFDASLALATAYEWLFWVAAGVLVMSGVGNLGTYAPAIPGGTWASTMTWKFFFVLLVLVGSAVRSLLVVRWHTLPSASAPHRLRVLRVGYGVTALALAGVVVLAEVLAHG